MFPCEYVVVPISSPRSKLTDRFLSSLHPAQAASHVALTDKITCTASSAVAQTDAENL